MDTYYIIEHATRGVLLGQLSPEGKPSFSPTRLRSDEGLARYQTLRYALLDAENVPGAYVMRTPVQPGDRWCRYQNGDWVLA